MRAPVFITAGGHREIGYPFNARPWKAFAAVTTMDILMIAGPLTVTLMIAACILAIATEGV